MSGRLFVGGFVLFALIFGAALWWFQTRGFYEETAKTEVIVAGAVVPVGAYQGIDADTSPLKLRSCFTADPIDGPAPERPDPLIAPGWFAGHSPRVALGRALAGAARPWPRLAEPAHLSRPCDALRQSLP
ncbi:MAG: DUF6446 family protein, partial [Pseudomonadota bacterium]